MKRSYQRGTLCYGYRFTRAVCVCGNQARSGPPLRRLFRSPNHFSFPFRPLLLFAVLSLASISLLFPLLILRFPQN